MQILHKLIDVMAIELFKPEARRIDTRVAELDRQNGEIRRAREWGFQWQGHQFRVPGSPYKGNKLPALDFRLRHEGNALLRDIQAVKDDKQMVKQVMALLLKDCTSLQEMRDALPESLVELSQDMQRLPRTREAGWPLTDPRQQRQFQKLLDKLDFYAATRLMY